MIDEEQAWAAMSGEELAHILALEAHARELQAALDDARTTPSADWLATAHAVLARLHADPAHGLCDETAGKSKPITRVEVLADELMRAHFEEG